MEAPAVTDSPEPTDRDRFWLDHEKILAASGQTAKAYAAEQDLSLHAFYQARKRLRVLGLLPTTDLRRKPKAASAFAKIELIKPPRPAADFRLGLPNGITLEWSGAELPSPVVQLLERLIALR
jgi:hypothetical protein